MFHLVFCSGRRWRVTPGSMMKRHSWEHSEGSLMEAQGDITHRGTDKVSLQEDDRQGNCITAKPTQVWVVTLKAASLGSPIWFANSIMKSSLPAAVYCLDTPGMGHMSSLSFVSLSLPIRGRLQSWGKSHTAESGQFLSVAVTRHHP